MHRAKFKFGIAHCNFDLRGKESDRDEKFVKKLADKYGVPFYSKRFETDKYALEKKISIQMAARELRYDWFREIRYQENYVSLATAHHQNDVVETVLMNLIKGTGIAGLHGILPKKNGVIRPLLFINREEIESFAKEQKLKFREDSSNASDKYIRNKIRHQIIPVMKEINPSLEKTFMENVERFKEVEDIVERYVHDFNIKNGVLAIENQNMPSGFRIETLQNEPHKLTILSDYLSEYGFTFDVIKEIIKILENPITGKQFLSSTDKVLIDRKYILLTQRREPLKQEFVINKGTRKITSDYFELNFISNSEPVIDEILKMKDFYHFDKDKLIFPLKMRLWQQGDLFYPLGMTKRKKLSDFLIDSKVPRFNKDFTFVVTSGNDIVCVLGHRIDNRYKITDDTKKVFTIHFKEK
jgi:tRNA(Ile)-lysidine synthase